MKKKSSLKIEMNIFASSSSVSASSPSQRRRIFLPRVHSPQSLQNTAQFNTLNVPTITASSSASSSSVVPSFATSYSSSTISSPLPYSGNLVSSPTFPSFTTSGSSTSAETIPYARPTTPSRNILDRMRPVQTFTPSESARPTTPSRNVLDRMRPVQTFTPSESARPTTPSRNVLDRMSPARSTTVPDHVAPMTTRESVAPITTREAMENSTTTRPIIAPLAYTSENPLMKSRKRVIIIPKVRSCERTIDNMGTTQYNESNHGCRMEQKETRPLVSQGSSVHPRRVVIIPKPRVKSPSTDNTETQQMHYQSRRM